MPSGEQKLELLDSGTGSLLYTGNIKLNPGDRVELSRLIPPARKIELRLEGGVFVPLSGAARATLPVSPAAALRLHSRNWPAPLLTAEMSISMFGGTGATATYAEPYDLLGMHLQVGLGRMFDLGHGVSLEPQLQVGNLWLSRSFRQFSGSDSLRAFTFTPALELAAAPSDAFRVGLRLETSIFAASLEGTEGLHAAGQFGLLAGFSF